MARVHHKILFIYFFFGYIFYQQQIESSTFLDLYNIVFLHANSPRSGHRAKNPGHLRHRSVLFSFSFVNNYGAHSTLRQIDTFVSALCC